MGAATISAAFATLVFFPSLAAAQIVISEIMYNPDGSDSGREWLELYNAGEEDVTMTGGTGKGSWRISDSSNHTLTDPAGGVGRGSLVIPAGGYLVVSNDPSTFITDYSGGSYSVIKSSLSLNNTGATVSLVDGNGTTLDSVSYAKEQGAYDDGTSLQKTGSGAWIAAQPTPGSANATAAYVPPADSATQSTPASGDATAKAVQESSSGSGSSRYVPPPPLAFFADAGADRAVVVGAEVEFDARAYDSARKQLYPSDGSYAWNFGDGSVGEGAKMTHHYDHPGTYAVVLSVSQNGHTASDPVKVTVAAATLDLSRDADGGVAIVNNGRQDADLSRWIIVDGAAQRFALPLHTLLLAGASMHVSAATLGFIADANAQLDYPYGGIAATATPTSTPATATADPPAAFAAPLPSTQAIVPSAAASVTASAPAKKKTPKTNVPKPSGIRDDPPVTSMPTSTSPASSTAIVLSQTATAVSFASGSNWWLAALALSGLGGIALALARRKAKGEWNIIEDIAE